MTSDKQIAANRLNAKKCTGPKTAEGKRRSSQNSFKTGIDSKSEIMACESKDEYDALIADFYRDYAPYDAVERSFLDTMIKSEWLNRRYTSTAAAIWDKGFADADDRSMGKTFIHHQQAFARANQCLNSAIRNFDKAFLRLTTLQAQRASSEPMDTSEVEITAEAAPERHEPAAEPHESNVATETLNLESNPEMVSFLKKSEATPADEEQPAPEAPKTPEQDPEINPQEEIDPPIAA